MGMRSRRKGKGGEREAAAEIRRLFRVDACRGRQFAGTDDSPDIRTAIERVHFEVNPEFRVFGMFVGCGIDVSRLQFDYGRRIIAKPILGCGVVINGRRAVFEPWLLKSR
jgi:hypothetical protein